VHDVNISSLRAIPIVHHANLQHLIALGYHHPSCISPLSIHHGETPNLPSSPPCLSLHPALHYVFSSRSALLALAIEPFQLQKVIIDEINCDPATPSLQLTKDMIGMLQVLPVDFAPLRGTFDAACGGLVDIDMDDFVAVRVLLDVESNGCEANSLAGQPTYALELEYGLKVVGEGLVLQCLLAAGHIELLTSERDLQEPIGH